MDLAFVKLTVFLSIGRSIIELVRDKGRSSILKGHYYKKEIMPNFYKLPVIKYAIING